MRKSTKPTVTATLAYLAFRHQIQRPSRTWPAIESSLAQVTHAGNRRRGYVIDLQALGKVKISGYSSDLLVTCYPRQTLELVRPSDAVDAQLGTLNQYISKALGRNLHTDHQLDHAVLEYVADYAEAAVHQSAQQWQQHCIIRSAPVMCNIRSTLILYKHKPMGANVNVHDTRLTSRVEVLPHDHRFPSQLRIRVELRPDLLTTVRNKSREAKWTLHALCGQHQQLHRRAIDPLVAHLIDFRPSRCVLALASWPPACKRAFATWVSGRDVRCDAATWSRMSEFGIDLSSKPSAREIDALSARVLTAADLRDAAVPYALELRQASPDPLMPFDRM